MLFALDDICDPFLLDFEEVIFELVLIIMDFMPLLPFDVDFDDGRPLPLDAP